MYIKVKNIKPVIGGLGVSILTTNRGIMTDKQAKITLLLLVEKLFVLFGGE